jgi:hypothetical protein
MIEALLGTVLIVVAVCVIGGAVAWAALYVDGVLDGVLDGAEDVQSSAEPRPKLSIPHSVPGTAVTLKDARTRVPQHAYAALIVDGKDLKLSDDVLRLTARREDELEAEVEQLQQELADAHSAHATVAGLLREAYEPQPDALDSPEMQALPF